MVNNTEVVVVASMGKNTRVIGRDNDLIWHTPADMKRFKALTTGKPIIMGRKTFESILEILGKPLPGRTNIVLTRNTDYHYKNILTATTLEESFTKALEEKPTEIHIGGGAELYRQALPYVDKLYMTYFFDDSPGDTTFPEFENYFTVVEKHPVLKHDDLAFQWVDYKRKGRPREWTAEALKPKRKN